MRLVLSRPIKASDGVTYPEGTPLDQLPAENRESLAGICWTRPAPPKPVIVDVPPESTIVEPVADSAVEIKPIGMPIASAPPTSPPEMPDESPSIDTLELSDDIKSKLAGAGIATVAQARAYALANKGFRTIKGIVKATNEQIIEAISEPE